MTRPIGTSRSSALSESIKAGTHLAVAVRDKRLRLRLRLRLRVGVRLRLRVRLRLVLRLVGAPVLVSGAGPELGSGFHTASVLHGQHSCTA